MLFEMYFNRWSNVNLVIGEAKAIPEADLQKYVSKTNLFIMQDLLVIGRGIES